MNRICVFCGSSKGNSEDYSRAAVALAECMVARNLDLVYGGASIGIMGAIANAVLERGGKVYGVIPEHLQNYEIGHDHLTELHIVSNMHERKALMAELADGFVALPGGIGTLEELIEICTWQQLGLHGKPCGMLNVRGFFDHLAAFLLHCEREGFLREEHRTSLLCEATPELLLNAMQCWQDSYIPGPLKIPEA